MALSGIQIYKMLPKTNCKDCGFPTCLAFSMKLAAQQIELSACPHVSEESKAELAASSEPPIRLVTLTSAEQEVKVGNEVVMFRHEKTFYNKPGIFLRVTDEMDEAAMQAKIKPAEAYNVLYVGIDLALDGFVVESLSADAGKFAAAVSAARNLSKKPFILIAKDPAVMEAGANALEGEKPLLYGANPENWEAMSDLALAKEMPLGVTADSLDELAELTEKLKEKGLKDLVLYPGGNTLGESLTNATIIRRSALKKSFRPFGFPTIVFPAYADSPVKETLAASQGIAKYAGFVVMETFTPELIYPLLVLRENIYTDPQKPIQVQPGVYEINNPGDDDPVLVTTNFSITYFSVANEVESAGISAWLLVADAEGMSVLTAWAAGNFDAELIAKNIKLFEVASKTKNRNLVIPGHVSILSGELEEELPDWQIRVGPREAVDLPSFLKQAL